jgi:putative addiction module killer protein
MRVQMTEVYRDWINALKDRAGRARIQMRIDRLAHGNPGQHRYLADGVYELKIDAQSRKEVNCKNQDCPVRCVGTAAHAGRNGCVP